MKKFATVILVLTLIFSVALIPVHADDYWEVLLGDLNYDGFVKPTDARICLRYALALDIPSSNDLIVGDVTNDGQLKHTDARYILRYALGLDNMFPIGTLTCYLDIPADNPNYPENPDDTVKNDLLNAAPDDNLEKLDAKGVYEHARKYTVEVYADCGYSYSTGSGFFISKDGLLITNYHVIEGAQNITVFDYNNNVFPCNRILGYSAGLDIAILKAETEVETEFAPLSFDYATADTIYTLGSSKGLTDTFSDGLISNTARILEDVNPTLKFIQITAPISMGNSGGPLIDSYGRVIGINSMTYNEAQNINFAIPLKYVAYLDISNPITVEEFAEENSGSIDIDIPDLETNAEFNQSETDLYMMPGSRALIICAIYTSDEDFTLMAKVRDPDASVLIQWSQWLGEYIILFVTAYDYGETYIDFYFEEYPDDVFGSVYVNVSAMGSETYIGEINIPDFGALFGVIPYEIYASDDFSAIDIWYTADFVDTRGYDLDYVINTYFDMLYSYNFSYVQTLYPDSETTLYEFFCAETGVRLWLCYLEYEEGYTDFGVLYRYEGVG